MTTEQTPRAGQWSAEHLEALRVAAQAAEQRESEMRTKLAESAEQYTRGYSTQVELAEMAECYSMAKRACFRAQERYREAIKTHWSDDPQSDTSASCP